MTPPLKILHLNGSMNCGGAEAFLMNVMRNIDRKIINFDFCLIPAADFFYSEEIKKLGGNIYTYPFKTKKNILLPFYAFTVIKTLLTKGPYQAVHTHYHFINGIALFFAWLCGVKVRVCHSHQNLPCDTLKLRIVRAFSLIFIKLFATDLCACSVQAGKALYGDKLHFTVIKNGIDADSFAFNPDIRKKERKALNIEGNFVLAHTGRFVIEKNHKFLLEVFAEILKIKPDAVLLLAGYGALEAEIREKAQALSITDKVIFLGLRSDVANILQAADAFVFPSVKEGLPVAGVEAQAAGLPCFFSDIITMDIDICNSFFISLNVGAKEWAEEILKISFSFERKNTSAEIKRVGFDAKASALSLQEIYSKGI